MKKFTLGIKKQRLSFFSSDGKMSAATLVSLAPLKVSDIRTVEKNGYSALVVGFGKTKKEFRIAPEEIKDFKIGEEIKMELAAGDKIKVSGTTKGKGFQGVVKRHGFGGGRRTHGQKHSEREPGSIGGGGRAGGRVAKGIRMAGRMGGEKVTVKNLQILDVTPETLLVSGAVPGHAGALVRIEAI
jgi:large subunit ribosomal protein L3